MKYYLETWGCQMNEHDSEVLAGLLEEMGYTEAPSEEEADFILLNTCCVRGKAEEKVYGRLGQLKRLKSRNPALLIGVAGCMTQQAEEAERMRRRAPYVDLIMGTHNRHRLPELLARVRETASPLTEIWEQGGEVQEHLPAKRAGGLKAFLTIMYGCNNYCSYCIVPFVRGRERSRRPEDVLSELEGLAAEGVREVTLLGQNVNSYGKDLEEGIDFAELLARACQVKGLLRLRFTTSHPKDMSQRLIEAVANYPPVAKHIHLPVQAGSNKVLEGMHRRYSREDYLELVERIRVRIPQVALTTDLIVGFPGETEEDFTATLELLEKVRFDAAFTFLYSPRRGTRAARLEDSVLPEVKKERFARLLELQNRISLEINRALLGREEEVLVEGPSKTEPSLWSGRTSGNKIVVFPAIPERYGKLLKVRITRAETWTLFGDPC